jgi:hypothetical protein
LASLVAGLALMAPARTARAGDPAAAEALFQQGRTLVESGKLAEACEKFQSSQALDPSAGTLLNLADCHEREQKTATAWAEFLAAARLAREQRRPELAGESERRARDLEPKLSYLTIQVEAPVSGLELRRNDILIPPASFGVRAPVDPGEQVLTATAPGYKPRRLTVQVAARDQQSISVPPLEPEGDGSAAAAAVPPPSPTAGPAGDRSAPDSPASEPSAKPSALPWIVGGAGAALLVTGGIFGALALSSNGEAQDGCSDPANCNDADALDAADRRNTQATIANVGVGLGIVGVGIGVVLLLTQPDRESTASSIGVDVALGRGSVGLSIGGRL